MPLFITDEMKPHFNELARELYALMGYHVAEDENFDFSASKHPTERLMWQMAVDSYDFWRENELFAEGE